jgi:hypothetical protein
VSPLLSSVYGMCMLHMSPGVIPLRELAVAQRKGTRFSTYILACSSMEMTVSWEEQMRTGPGRKHCCHCCQILCVKDVFKSLLLFILFFCFHVAYDSCDSGLWAVLSDYGASPALWWPGSSRSCVDTNRNVFSLLHCIHACLWLHCKNLITSKLGEKPHKKVPSPRRTQLQNLALVVLGYDDGAVDSWLQNIVV